MSNSTASDTKAIQQANSVLEQSLSTSLKVVDRFGALIKGNQKDLDHKLAELRKNVKKSDSIDSVLDAIVKVNETLKPYESTYTRNLRALKDDILKCGEELQALKGMDADVRRNLRMVLNKIKSTDSIVLAELQPNISKFVKLVIAITHQQTQPSVTTGNVDSAQVTNTPHTSKMMKNLIDGLTSIAESEVIKPSLDTFADRIRIAKTEEQQLDICLSFFEDVVGRFSEEFSQTQSLILNINKALSDVHETLVDSLRNSKNYDKQLKALNRQIDKQIKDLSDSTNNASSLQELQVVIDKKLTVINTSIKKRDDIEQQRSDKLQQALNAMEAKLSGLEKRTDYYRNKWLEEKVRNGIDTLTGLPNRGAYDNKIQEEYQRWLRHPQPLTIAVIDIDHFKNINDTYGHSVGDKTLKIVANTLRKNLRSTDFLARYGGEEFVAIMLNSEPNSVAGPLEKLRKAVEKIPFKVKDTPLNITISIGYTALLAVDNVHTAFDRADKALYEAKESGRNRVCYKK